MKDWHYHHREKEKAIAPVVFVLEFVFVVLKCDFIMRDSLHWRVH